MNNQYYEYLSNINNVTEEMDEKFYPKAFRQNVMPNSFSDMLNIENYMNIISNDNMNMQNNNMNQNCGLYSSYEGFMKGNMFPQLYSPYKGYKPKQIKTNSEQQAMMLEIQELCFALVDMNLYLDVHPDDKCMINLFNETLSKKKKLVNDYELKYGPITIDGRDLDKTPWAWNNVKSPWERGY